LQVFEGDLAHKEFPSSLFCFLGQDAAAFVAEAVPGFFPLGFAFFFHSFPVGSALGLDGLPTFLFSLPFNSSFFFFFCFSILFWSSAYFLLITVVGVGVCLVLLFLLMTSE
jgi:hypothetical protein